MLVNSSTFFLENAKAFISIVFYILNKEQTPPAQHTAVEYNDYNKLQTTSS